MTQNFNTGKLLCFHNGNNATKEDNADYVIDDHLMTVDLTARTNEYKGVGKVEINNSGGEYSQTVRTGDRVEFVLGGSAADSGYGAGGYGVGPYPGGLTRRWTGCVRPYEIDDLGQDNAVMTLTVEQFAPCVMSFRDVYATFENRQIVGTNGIINEVVSEECPELNTSRLPDRPETTSIWRRGQTVLETVAQLAVRLDMILCFDGIYLDLVDPQAVTPKFEAVRTEDVGEIKTNVNDDNLVNDLRVEGGTGHDPESQSSQTTVNGYQTVTNSNRLTYQINTRKDQLERLEIWTRKTGSGEDFTIRLQKDDNGAPIAPGDNKSDIVTKTLDPTFVDNNGFTDFILPNHHLPEPFPWVIMESSGPTGQEIGINTATGEPGIIPHFPYEVVVNRISADSINMFRRREDKVSDDDLGTFSAADDLALEILAKRDEPTIRLTVEAFSDDMHGLTAGDVVTFDYPPSKAVGEFVVLEVKDVFELGKLTTDITLQQL